MKSSLLTAYGVFTLTLAISNSALLAQGALTPPAGAPAPTMKTLTQIEPRTLIDALPFTITTPGSYYLASNLQSSGENLDGIIIDSDNVTVDLMGFELLGFDTGFGGDGILIFGIQRNITIRNGTIRNWRDEGINAVNGSLCRFENLRILDNDTDGLICNDGNVLINCIASGNGNDGLDTDDGCIVVNCTATANGDNGIETDDGCTIENCTGYLNQGHGIECGDGSVIRGCSGLDNETFGIEANSGSMILDSVAALNTSHGINVGQGCHVSRCASRNNGGYGFRAFSADTLIRNCRADGNTMAGFFTGTSDVRFDNNHSTDNAQGFQSTGTGSFFTRNTASGNITNYDIATSVHGPIVNVLGQNDISGVANSNHPLANFEF